MLINQKDLENIAEFWGGTYEEYQYKILVVGETIDSAKDYAYKLMSEHSDEFYQVFSKYIRSKNFHIYFTSKDEFFISRGHQYNFVIIENFEEMLEYRFLNKDKEETFASILRAFGREVSSTKYKVNNKYTPCSPINVPEASLSYNERFLDFNGRLPTLKNISRKWNKLWNIVWGEGMKKNENKLNVLLIGNTHEDIYEMALKITKTYKETLIAGLNTSFESESFSFNYTFWENEEVIPRNSGIEFVVAKDLLNKTFDKDGTRTDLAYNKLLETQRVINYTQEVIESGSRLYIETSRIIDWKNIKFFL